MSIQRVIITHPYPLDAPGGGTRTCLEIAHNLEKLGIEVILLPLMSTPPLDSDRQTIRVVSVAPNRFQYLLSGIAVAQTIRGIADRHSVDAVISWGYEAAFLPPLLRSKQIVFGMIAAMPSYTEWANRETKFRFIKRWVDEWFRWRTFKEADVVFSFSNFTKKELVSLFHLQPNRIDNTRHGIESIFSGIPRLQHIEEISNFIFYGSLAPIKGVFDVVTTLGEVARRGYRNWKLKIAGWGDEEALWQALHQCGIADQVQFLGCLNPQELVRELEWAHLAILPSQAESFGRSIAEAQAAGLPVVSYDTGSIPEIVEQGITGWLAPPKQTDRLADAVIEAMQDPQRTFQMGLAGRERVTQQFSWEKTAKAILEGIEDAKRRLS
ncbi:glycosyltransferase family 4 protein [Phormidium sp. FACHB-592]|uniref:Glycosyltransferase family 4 protein n=1 Tax=Stenomitos frigidus AS-A4 TaxID=2933935 RepID=A0ABV0KMB0_9CYAN|nr:glycosyltransferase family 4 protein [Phormidium sp. FACHB-592]MBD2072641.1 glycosyltransferase family 4 protein [Phormidium sp. FACHB-592]